MSVGTSTTGDLFLPPRYPGHGQAADARQWIAHKVGIDLSGVARYANPNDVLREAIKNYGESIIAGKAPNGRTETLRQLFERTLGAFEPPKEPKRATPRRHYR